MREPLVAVGRKGPAEPDELEREQKGERPGDARRRGDPCPPAPEAWRRGERRERQRDERDVHAFREDEPAREEAGQRREPRPALPARAHREQDGEDETNRLERFREPVRRVGPERRAETRPEDGEGLPERPRAEIGGEEAGAAAAARHEERLEEDEERLRRPDAEARLPWSGEAREGDLDEGQAHAVRRDRVAARAGDANVWSREIPISPVVAIEIAV